MKQASDYANTLKGAALYARDKWDLHDAPVEGGAQQKEDGRRDRGDQFRGFLGEFLTWTPDQGDGQQGPPDGAGIVDGGAKPQ